MPTLAHNLLVLLNRGSVDSAGPETVSQEGTASKGWQLPSALGQLLPLAETLSSQADGGATKQPLNDAVTGVTGGGVKSRL
jgi:hypothetical protein